MRTLQRRSARLLAFSVPAALVAVVLATCSSVSAAGPPTASSAAPPAIALTLVPPSPVSDQIDLDIRAAVRNTATEPRRFDIRVYLDRETPDTLLHSDSLEVAAGAAGGARFRCPTAGRDGRHELIVVANSGTQSLRTTQPLEVLTSGVRGTGRIDGAWAGIEHWSEDEGRLWNDEIREMTDEQWRELVRAMDDVGMKIIVIQELFRNQAYVGKHSLTADTYPGKAFFPSQLYRQRMPIAAADAVRAILTEADARGMHVFLGIGLFAWFDFGAESLRWHKAVSDEVWEMYGRHPSFYGWYVAEEVEGGLAGGARDEPLLGQRHREIVNFFREFTAHVRRLAPDKPVMLATNSHDVRFGAAVYPHLLPHLDIICPFGFHRMPGGDYTGEHAAKVLQQFCDEAGSHLWLDLEVFDFGPGGALRPRPIHGVVDDLYRFPHFEKVLCYQFPGLMSSPLMSRKPGGEPTVALYRDYQRFVAEGGPNAGVVRHAAEGRPLTLSTPPTPPYTGGSDIALADGRVGRATYRHPAWVGFEGNDLDARIDLETPTPVGRVEVSCLQFVPGGIFLPEQVEVSISSDGEHFDDARVLGHDIADSVTGPFIHSFTADSGGVMARSVRVRAKNAGPMPAGHPAAGRPAWLFVDEISVKVPGRSPRHGPVHH